MSDRGAPDAGDDDAAMTLWERVRYGRGGLPLSERLRNAMLKPVAASAADEAEPKPQSVEELRTAERYADDKERLVGLLAAPVAAAIRFLVANYLVDHNPPAYLKNGLLNPAHGNVAVYHTLEIVLMGLGLVMLATAWYRRRLFLGIAMALYGLGIFNLHYWGFGIPFLMVGAWLLVRAYRAHQAVRVATGQGPQGGRPGSGFSRPKPNKRYTPPV